MNKVYIFGFLILGACATTQVLPSQSDVDRVQSKFPGYTLANLNEGKSLYEKNCALCHKLEKPKAHSEAEWKHEVPEMVELANEKKGTNISKGQEELILRYVLTMGGH